MPMGIAKPSPLELDREFQLVHLAFILIRLEMLVVKLKYRFRGCESYVWVLVANQLPESAHADENRRAQLLKADVGRLPIQGVTRFEEISVLEIAIKRRSRYTCGDGCGAVSRLRHQSHQRARLLNSQPGKQVLTGL